jgi:hypothetical protein
VVKGQHDWKALELLIFFIAVKKHPNFHEDTRDYQKDSCMYQLNLFLSATNTNKEGNKNNLLNKRLWVASKTSCTVSGLRK